MYFRTKSSFIQRQQLNILSLLSLVVFVFIGGLVHHHFMQDSLFVVFFEGWDFSNQAWIGLAFGMVSAFLAWALIKLPVMKTVRAFFLHFLKPFHLRMSDILFISACAGIGEELLFRATLQPVLGIWLTALLFVTLHGYLSIHNWPLTIYGIFMIIVAAGLGYLYRHIGIVAAIIAHFAIDVALLLFIRTAPIPKTTQEKQGQTSEE